MVESTAIADVLCCLCCLLLLLSGALLAAMKSRMLEFCMHEKGVYVVQCAANLTNNSELVEMAQVGEVGGITHG